MIVLEKYNGDSFNHLKQSFKKYYNYQIQKEDIIYNEYKKPYLKNNHYYFNISHTKDKIVIIIDESEVGIDIEKIRDFNKGVANRLFTKEELEYAENSNEKFTEIFTKKRKLFKI